jgi:hypothetical protein
MLSPNYKIREKENLFNKAKALKSLQKLKVQINLAKQQYSYKI